MNSFTSEDLNNLGFEIEFKYFKQKLPTLGYSIREPQIEMACEILDMVKTRKQCLVVEAGVGTGKSFGYLVPLIHMKRASRFKDVTIILSTGTIALQEQLIKDIESTLNNMEITGQRVILAKGATHFLCEDRLQKHYKKVKNAPQWVEKWQDYSLYGDRAQLENVIPAVDAVWDKINVEKCKWKKCGHYNSCKFVQFRDELRQPGNIIITNHDQLLANARMIERDVRPLFPNDIDVVVIDEAHNLEEKARNAFKEQWSKRKIQGLLEAADPYFQRMDNVEEIEERKQQIQTIINEFFDALYSHCMQQAVEQQKEHGAFSDKFSVPELPINLSLIKELKSHNDTLQLVETEDESLDQLIAEYEDVISFLECLQNRSNHIVWLEMKEQHKVSLSINALPNNINEILYNYFFSEGKPRKILTSATISKPGESTFDKYEYFLENVGIDLMKDSQLVLSEPKLSPFDYDKNAMLYISPSLPSPSNIDQFRQQGIEEIVKLLQLTNGRSLVLFTSKEDMNYVHSKLSEMNVPWPILLQKEGSNQQSVKDQFKADEKSVLFSTGIFWEGIDIPGPSLSNLIVFRLPFPVPDPMLEHKAAHAKEDPMLEVYVPEMLIKLRQGLGRLIRKEDDKGIACILDPRLSKGRNRTYREQVLSVLPFRNFTEDMDHLATFVKNTLAIND